MKLYIERHKATVLPDDVRQAFLDEVVGLPVSLRLKPDSPRRSVDGILKRVATVNGVDEFTLRYHNDRGVDQTFGLTEVIEVRVAEPEGDSFNGEYHPVYSKSAATNTTLLVDQFL